MTDAISPSKPTGRAALTRQALLDAGRKLFSERAVDAVTIDEIVLAAKVAKGSFYNHFADRAALVRAVTADIRSGLERAVAKANEGITDPAHRTVRGFCVYLAFAAQQPERAGALMRIQGGHTAMDAPLNQGLVKDIAAGQASGRFVLPSLEAGVLLVMGSGQIALARLQESPPGTDVALLAEQLCTLLLRSFGLDQTAAQAIAAQAATDLIRTAS